MQIDLAISRRGGTQSARPRTGTGRASPEATPPRALDILAFGGSRTVNHDVPHVKARWPSESRTGDQGRSSTSCHERTSGPFTPMRRPDGSDPADVDFRVVGTRWSVVPLIEYWLADRPLPRLLPCAMPDVLEASPLTLVRWRPEDVDAPYCGTPAVFGRGTGQPMWLTGRRFTQPSSPSSLGPAEPSRRRER